LFVPGVGFVRAGFQREAEDELQFGFEIRVSGEEPLQFGVFFEAREV
jgi:hypothetical protein